MTENVEEILKKAVEALDSSDVNECIEYCEQAFLLAPEDSNVKIMKAVSILLSYSESEAHEKGGEVVNILKTISDIDSITDEFKITFIDALYSFRNCWEKDRSFFSISKRYELFKKDDGLLMKIFVLIFAFPSLIQNSIASKGLLRSFMGDIIQLSWLQNDTDFLKSTIENIKHRKIKDVSYINELCSINDTKDGVVKELTEEIARTLKKIKRRRRIVQVIKWLILICLLSSFLAMFL
mgnify:FL=1